jgi:hypothetical protein
MTGELLIGLLGHALEDAEDMETGASQPSPVLLASVVIQE